MPTEQNFPSSVLTLDESESLDGNDFAVLCLEDVRIVVCVENHKPATVFRRIEVTCLNYPVLILCIFTN